MIPLFSRVCTLALAIIAMAVMLPAGFDKVFVRPVEEPLLFYSPVRQQFVYQKSLGEHRFEYRDEEGTAFDRQVFEEQLPFLYHRNLALRNRMPVVIDGAVFDADSIQQQRQAMEIRARHLRGHFPQLALYPLFNNDPQVAIMPFPEDMFRFTDKAMEFLNADHNQVDTALTKAFTRALLDQGFIFPPTLIAGKPTNLKPFDDGYFVRDGAGRVFQIRRVANRPEVVKTPIDPTLDILDIVVSENRRREFHGTLITRQGNVYLIETGSYRLIPLETHGYDPQRMDFKLLVDPLYRTVTFSDRNSVQGIALDAAYRPLRKYAMAAGDPNAANLLRIRDLLFPFHIQIESPYRGQAALGVTLGGFWSLAGNLCALAALFLLFRSRHRWPMGPATPLLILVSGWYGLIAAAFVQTE
jgi:hypothetical protein